MHILDNDLHRLRQIVETLVAPLAYHERRRWVQEALGGRPEADRICSKLHLDGAPESAAREIIRRLIEFKRFHDGAYALAVFLDFIKEHVGRDDANFIDTLLKEESSSATPIEGPSSSPALPRRPIHFIDREKELDDIMLRLQPGCMITLCGSGGIGKTALALEAIGRLEEKNELLKRFPDNTIFYSFYEKPEKEEAFEHIVRSFGEDTSDISKETVKRMLFRKIVLLVLDSAEQAKDIRAVLDVTNDRRNGIIITSRSRRDIHAEQCVLPPLPEKEARKLLCAWAGDCPEEDEAILEICRCVGGLPLALRLAGRYLNQTRETPAEYLEWLKESIEALSPSHAKRREESVKILLSRSLEQVSQEAREVLAIVGQLALALFAIEPVAAAIGYSGRQTRNALGELVRYSLLDRPDERYEVSHALLHKYAKEQMSVETEKLRRLAEYYTDFATTQSEQGVEGYARLDAERPHLMKVMENCQEQEEWQAVMSVVWAIADLDGYLERQGYWTEHQAALGMGVEAARKLNNREDEGKCLKNLGTIYRDLGPMDKAIAYYEQALAIAREIGDRRGEGNNLGNLGAAYYILGEMDKAIEYHEQALAISREIGDRRGEGSDLGNLGIAYSDLGQMERAINYYEQALAIRREISDRQGEGEDLNGLGSAYRKLGQVEQALEYCRQALTIHQEIKYRKGEGEALGELGNVYRDLGQLEKAMECFEQALAIHRDITYRKGEAQWLFGLGKTSRDSGEVEQSREYFQQALTIFEEIKSPETAQVRKWLAELEAP